MGSYKTIKSSSNLISFGNTGARLSDPRATYVKILNALVEFRGQNENWELKDQAEFGDLLGEQGIFDIKTNNKVSSDKDVRVKTGFISELGFATDKRVVTSVGEELIANSISFEKNEFEISKESFTYLKQFLKYQQKNFEIIPLLSLVYSIIEFNNALPTDFFTYIWAGSQTEKELIKNIETYNKYSGYKETVYQSVVNSLDTKIVAKNCKLFFPYYSITDKKELKELLYVILPHGKGNSFKDKTIAFFYDIHSYWLNKEKWDETKKRKFINDKLKPRHKDISSKKPTYYLEALFDATILNNASDWEKVILFFENTALISSENEEFFVLNFHVLYMFIKKLSICEEYRDLNIRHLKLTDIFIFENESIKLDVVFWYLFKSVKSELLKPQPLLPNKYRIKLEESRSNIVDIYDFLKTNITELSTQIAIDFPEIKQLGLRDFASKKKEERLRNLVNEVFTKENIIKIFKSIYPRNDKDIRKMIKKLYLDYEATIPALFEYLLGISFYWLTNKRIKLSSILHANLDANLLPKTHTIGGRADIVVRYNNRDYLIEATLSDKDGQRKMEAEPVPRHLAKHILEVNSNSKALFVAGQLDPNNLVALRNYKFSPWYHANNQSVKSMDILPLSTSNMIYLLKQNIEFEELESQFETLLNSETDDGFKWYTKEINATFSNGN